MLQRVAGQHSKSVGNSGFLRRLPDAAGHFVGDHLIVQRIATQQASDADNRVMAFGFGKLSRNGRNLERSRHMNDGYVVWLGAALPKRLQCAVEQTLGDKRIEPADDQGKAFAARVELAFQATVLAGLLRISQKTNSQAADFDFE